MPLALGKRASRVAAGLALLSTVAACSGGQGASPSAARASAAGSVSSTPAATVTAATEPSTATTPANSTAGSQPIASGSNSFTNPVINADFPDPFVASFDGRYYAYATGSQGRYLQVTSSADMVHWDAPHEALSRPPRWMTGDTWAPEVAKTSAGYVLYYSGRSGVVDRPNGEGALCLSIGISDKPEGPFLDQSDEPFVCQPDLGGSIDVDSFVDDDGSRYLVWKNDGNCCAIPTRLWIQPLSADGTALQGDGPTDTGMTDDVAWEDGVIEAPTLIKEDGRYYMFYSANRYDTHHYAVGYATADTVTGPYVDASENPILTNGAPAVGPGHQSIVVDDDGELWMAYHAWDVSALGYLAGGRRAMWIDPLTFTNGKPDVLGPNPSPQPIP